MTNLYENRCKRGIFLKMKILVICQYYAPEPFRITDICETLVAQGHEVMVIAGTPNYPEGYVYEGYKHGRKKDEVINGVRVHRCYTVGRRKGVLFRVLNYYSFVISSVRYAKRLREKLEGASEQWSLKTVWGVGYKFEVL